MVKSKKLGRPSKFSTVNPNQIQKLAEFGLTDKQMAVSVGVSEKTFENYKKNPSFLLALKRGKKLADKIVEASLFKRATGYSHMEDKIFCEKGEIITVPTIKHYPPDPTAMIFWLKNRKPDQWREKIDIDGSVSLSMVLVRPEHSEIKEIESDNNGKS